MAAGFKSPLPHLGLSSGSVIAQGGFRTPLPGWNAGGTTTGAQGGFRTPLPGWNAGGTSGPVTQGGFRGLLAFWAGGASAGEDTGRSPWWNYWRNKTGWYDTNAPSLAELVLSGQTTVIEAPTGEDVPAFIPADKESEELLLEAYGTEGLAGISEGIGINEEEAANTIRWMARQERKAIIEWRDGLIDQNNLIILLAMIDE